MRNLKIILFISILLFSPMLSLAADTSTGKEEEMLFMAKKAFEDGFYDASLGFLERFLKNYPDSAKAQEAHLLIGECLYYQHKFTAALAKFEGLLKEDRFKGIRDALYYWIAEVNLKGNNFTQASLYYKNIIQEFPASSYTALAYYSLGWCLFQEHKFKEARGYFKALLEKYPQGGPQGEDTLGASYLYFYLAEANYYLGDFNGALEAYIKVLANRPDAKMQAQALLNLGWSYLKLKRYPEAEDTFWSIKQPDLEKRNQDILLLGKAVVLMETNRINQAKKLYEELLAQANDPLILAQAWISRADCLYNLADYLEASRAYQEALAKIDLKGTASQVQDKLYYNLGWSWLKLGDTAGAINAFQKIIDLDHFDDASYSLGLAYFNKQDYHLASQILKKFQDTFKHSDLRPKALYLLGNCLYRLGDYPSAIKVFKEIPGLAGREAELVQKAEYAAADALYQMGEEKEALSRFKALRAKYPGSSLSPDILWWLGSYYYQHNQAELAQRYFLSLIQDFPQSSLLADAYYGLGLCLMDGPRSQEALDNFKKAVDLNQVNLKPGLAVLHLKIAELQESRGSLDDALKEYLEVVRLSAKDKQLSATALLRLGRIYEDKENIQEALKVYARILEMNIPESKYAEERITNLTFP